MLTKMLGKARYALSANVVPYLGYCSSKLTIYFSVAILPILWQKIVGLNLLEKQLSCNTVPLLCFDSNTVENTC